MRSGSAAAPTGRVLGRRLGECVEPLAVVRPALARMGAKNGLEIRESGVTQRLRKPYEGGGLDPGLRCEVSDASEGYLLRVIDCKISDLQEPLGQHPPLGHDQLTQALEVARRLRGWRRERFYPLDGVVRQSCLTSLPEWAFQPGRSMYYGVPARRYRRWLMSERDRQPEGRMPNDSIDGTVFSHL